MTENMDSFDSNLDFLTQQWENEIMSCAELKRALNYVAHDRSADTLLYNYGEEQNGLWPTLQSMRNVEFSAIARVL
jgi:hypothetical protein